MKYVLLTFTAVVFILAASFTNEAGNNIKETSPVSIDEKQEITWLTLDEAFKRSKKNPKKIFIDVYTDWCGWCKVMDKQTFSDPKIIEYMNATYYPVKFDAEQREPITYQGKEYKFVLSDPGRNKGYHELAAAILQGKLSYPTVVFMDEETNVITAIPGFRRPPELDNFLKYFGGDHHKTTVHETFSKNYQSPYSE